MKITKELVVPNYGLEGTQGPDGKPAIYTTVTNQNIVLNAQYQGLPSDYSKANGSIQVFEGDKEVTQQATYTLKQTLNVAAELDFNKFKVTHVSTDNGMFIVTVSYKEFVSDIMITTNVVRNGQSGQSSYIHKAWSWSADGTDRFTTKYPNENLLVRKGEIIDKYLGSEGKPVSNANCCIMLETIPVKTNEVINFQKTDSTEFYRCNWLTSDGKFHSRFARNEDGFGMIVPVGVTLLQVSYPKNSNNKIEKSTRRTIYTPSPKDDYENAYPKYEGYYSSHNPVQSTTPSDYEWTFIPHGERGPKGDKGDTGQDGPPTGIIESPTIPTEVYQGMLWKNTGNLSGFITDVTYIYRGSKWEKYIFTADNIYADNLAAITANLGDVTGGSFTGGKFINNFVDVPLLYNGTSKATGQTKIENGQITINGKIDNEFNFVTKFTVDAMSAIIYYPNSTSVMKSFSITPNGFLLVDNQNGFNGQLLASSLTKTPWVNLNIKPGYSVVADKPLQYNVKYNLDGTRTISFRGQVLKLSSGNIVDMEANSFNVVADLPAAITPNVESNGYGVTDSGNGCRVWAAITGVLGARIGTVKTGYVDFSSLNYIID